MAAMTVTKRQSTANSATPNPTPVATVFVAPTFKVAVGASIPRACGYGPLVIWGRIMPSWIARSSSSGASRRNCSLSTHEPQLPMTSWYQPTREDLLNSAITGAPQLMSDLGREADVPALQLRQAEADRLQAKAQAGRPDRASWPKRSSNGTAASSTSANTWSARTWRWCWRWPSACGWAMSISPKSSAKGTWP